jgi:hypothetical protein
MEKKNFERTLIEQSTSPSMESFRLRQQQLQVQQLQVQQLQVQQIHLQLQLSVQVQKMKSPNCRSNNSQVKLSFFKCHP